MTNVVLKEILGLQLCTAGERRGSFPLAAIERDPVLGRDAAAFAHRAELGPDEGVAGPGALQRQTGAVEDGADRRGTDLQAGDEGQCCPGRATGFRKAPANCRGACSG